MDAVIAHVMMIFARDPSPLPACRPTIRTCRSLHAAMPSACDCP